MKRGVIAAAAVLLVAASSAVLAAEELTGDALVVQAKIPKLSNWLDVGFGAVWTTSLTKLVRKPLRVGRKITITVSQPGANTELTRVLIGMHDYGSGIDPKSFNVTADFAIDGIKPGLPLAGLFKMNSAGVREMQLKTPIKSLERGTLTLELLTGYSPHDHSPRA